MAVSRRAAVVDAPAGRPSAEQPPGPGPLGPGPSRYELRFPVDAAAEVMAGHYPDVPIMPGVLVVDLVGQLIDEVSRGALRIAAIERLRFTSPMLPGDELLLTVSFTEDTSTGGVRALVRGHRADGVLANQMRLRLARTDGEADDRA